MTPSRAALETARAIAESQDCRPFDVDHAARLIDEKVGPLVGNTSALFAMFNTVEQSDGGRIFRPVEISCCRAMLTPKLGEHCIAIEEALAQWRPGGEGKP